MIHPFLQGFFENPKQVASLVPSSSYLQNELSSLPCFQTAQFVVELGPGTGGTTAALLRAIPRSSCLLCVEIVSDFVDQLRQISDKRLYVEEGSAFDLEILLKHYDFPPPDVIVSGVPFSNMTSAEGRKLIESIHSVLAPGGTFVTYQFRNRVCELAENYFGSPQSKSFVLWNIPPLGIYQWKKSPAIPSRKEAYNSQTTI